MSVLADLQMACTDTRFCGCDAAVSQPASHSKRQTRRRTDLPTIPLNLMAEGIENKRERNGSERRKVMNESLVHILFLPSSEVMVSIDRSVGRSLARGDGHRWLLVFGPDVGPEVLGPPTSSDPSFW